MKDIVKELSIIEFAFDYINCTLDDEILCHHECAHRLLGFSEKEILQFIKINMDNISRESLKKTILCIAHLDPYWNVLKGIDDPDEFYEYSTIDKENFELFIDLMWDKLREYKFI